MSVKIFTPEGGGDLLVQCPYLMTHDIHSLFHVLNEQQKIVVQFH